MLNCDESKSLRGVDMLLTSNTGIGDVSLAVELRREEKTKSRDSNYRDKIHHVIEYYAFCLI